MSNKEKIVNEGTAMAECLTEPCWISL